MQEKWVLSWGPHHGLGSPAGSTPLGHRPGTRYGYRAAPGVACTSPDTLGTAALSPCSSCLSAEGGGEQEAVSGLGFLGLSQQAPLSCLQCRPHESQGGAGPPPLCPVPACLLQRRAACGPPPPTGPTLIPGPQQPALAPSHLPPSLRVRAACPWPFPQGHRPFCSSTLTDAAPLPDTPPPRSTPPQCPAPLACHLPAGPFGPPGLWPLQRPFPILHLPISLL